MLKQHYKYLDNSERIEDIINRQTFKRYSTFTKRNFGTFTKRYSTQVHFKFLQINATIILDKIIQNMFVINIYRNFIEYFVTVQTFKEKKI